MEFTRFLKKGTSGEDVLFCKQKLLELGFYGTHITTVTRKTFGATSVNDETHVGLYLGRGMVIHAKGRDVGVVVEGINQGGSGYWHKCGRCKLLY